MRPRNARLTEEADQWWRQRCIAEAPLQSRKALDDLQSRALRSDDEGEHALPDCGIHVRKYVLVRQAVVGEIARHRGRKVEGLGPLKLEVARRHDLKLWRALRWSDACEDDAHCEHVRGGRCTMLVEGSSLALAKFRRRVTACMASLDLAARTAAVLGFGLSIVSGPVQALVAAPALTLRSWVTFAMHDPLAGRPSGTVGLYSFQQRPVLIR